MVGHGWAYGILILFAAVTCGAAGEGGSEKRESRPPDTTVEAPDSRVLVDLDLLRDLELLRQLDTMRKIDDVLGAPRTPPPREEKGKP